MIARESDFQELERIIELYVPTVASVEGQTMAVQSSVLVRLEKIHEDWDNDKAFKDDVRELAQKLHLVPCGECGGKTVGEDRCCGCQNSHVADTLARIKKRLSLP